MTRPPASAQAAAASPHDSYRREIAATALLTADQEKVLAREIRAGSAAARDHLVRANLRLVVRIARGYAGKGVDIQDLIEEGNLGLLRAAEGFDPDLDTRFSTYAGYWIRQSIKRGVQNTMKTIRVPAHVNTLLAKWRQATTELADDLRRPPDREEVAQFLGLSQRRLAMIEHGTRARRGASHCGGGNSGRGIVEVRTGTEAATPGDGIALADDLTQMRLRLDTMDERESVVLRMRFGLDDEDAMTLKEIGDRLGLTRERIRQIEREGLSHLRAQLAV
jgi:RNA polymerase primary sigma factor